MVLNYVLASPEAQALPEFGLRRDAMLIEARNIANGIDGQVMNDGAYALAEPFRQAQSRYGLIGPGRRRHHWRSWCGLGISAPEA